MEYEIGVELHAIGTELKRLNDQVAAIIDEERIAKWSDRRDTERWIHARLMGRLDLLLDQLLTDLEKARGLR